MKRIKQIKKLLIILQALIDKEIDREIDRITRCRDIDPITKKFPDHDDCPFCEEKRKR